MKEKIMEIVFDKGVDRIVPNATVIFALASGKHKQYFKRKVEAMKNEGYTTSDIRAKMFKRLRPHIDQLLDILERQIEEGYIQPMTKRFLIEPNWRIE